MYVGEGGVGGGGGGGGQRSLKWVWCGLCFILYWRVCVYLLPGPVHGLLCFRRPSSVWDVPWSHFPADSYWGNYIRAAEI